MTSPAITKSDEKPVEKKSPSRSEARAPSRAESLGSAAATDGAPRPGDMFGWLRVFKMAELMMRQGC